tara:strand:- start:2871 stop:3848 length:978 start_codon:yes stop_codon:yes gene_type:complete
MKNILVTGGAGYVGTALVPELLKFYNVTVLDLMIYGTKLPKNNKRLKIIKGDIRDKKKLNKATKGIDCVIHLACISNDPSFELNPKLGKSINLLAFEPLVKISKKNGVKRFIYASSSSVYGIKNSKNVNEKMRLKPLTDYSKFKADCEKILFKYSGIDFTSIVIRPATVCGFAPRQRFDLVVNILTNLAFNKREITVLGGKQLRPNIHISDMVRAYVHLIKADKKIVYNQIFNVGYQNQSVNKIAKIVKKIIGSDVRINVKKSNDNRSYHISSNKIKKILNFSPKSTIEDAVKDLKKAFRNKKFKKSLTDEMYFNIKRMQNIKLR